MNGRWGGATSVQSRWHNSLQGAGREGKPPLPYSHEILLAVSETDRQGAVVGREVYRHWITRGKKGKNMLLQGRDGSAIEATIVGYEFPGIEGQKWDSNHLFIRIRVTTPVGRGSSVDPCWTTWEVERLIAWFESLAAGEPASPVGFLESNLEFELAQQSHERLTLRVSFILERERRWVPGAQAPSREPQSLAEPVSDIVDLEVTRDAVRHAAATLRGELSHVPVRPWTT
jgi:hypothetical protein